ncbi:Myb-like DNA-binding domain [Musa troglodytarum]|uniref:Myb-like DNA-binding domain n=1 Tax=Musa troglodytarum TaxID=320322 RepID=A0A9E7JDH8_9LILI|nr:Myb-like DNA-binding domain [Musa troglodytarum]
MEEYNLQQLCITACLHMYRTVKNTDKPAVSSGHSDGFENGSTGEICDDNSPDNPDPRGPGSTAAKTMQHGVGLWSNSSRGGCFAGESTAGSMHSFKKDLRSKSLEMYSDMNSSCLSETLSSSIPSLEFTLGRSQ